MARFDLTPPEFDAVGARIGIAAARFNDEVVSRLLEAALDTLADHGLDRDAVPVARVPGAFELPLAARWLATRRLTVQLGPDCTEHEQRPVTTADAVIALGAVIEGDTPHFDYICAETARGIRAVSLEHDLPVIFGVLTCRTREQAAARAGGEHGNKGREAALAALEMVSLRRRLGA